MQGVLQWRLQQLSRSVVLAATHRVDQHWARMHEATASGVECVGMLRLLRRNQRDVSPLA